MEPRIEKYPHPHGVEYAWVIGDRVLGSVMPAGAQEHDKARKLWRAIAGQRVVGLFTGKNGRLAAMRAVQHFTRHQQLVAKYEGSA